MPSPLDSNPTPAISALVHTRNEAGNLGACLKSLAWTDEIVVADMASTDGTREIAKSFGARVVEMPMAPVVEYVRNKGIAECHGEWILIVDADEYVPEGLATALRQISATSQAQAFRLPRRNYFLGIWFEHGFWPDYQTRFFRKGSVVWSAVVHDVPRVEGRLEILAADPNVALEHPGFGSDLHMFIQKLVRYSPLEAAKLASGGRPPVWPYIIRRPFEEFFGRYFRGQAWRHGMHGLALSSLLAAYQLLIGIHYWALIRGTDRAIPSAKDLARGVRWEWLRSLAKLLWYSLR